MTREEGEVLLNDLGLEYPEPERTEEELWNMPEPVWSTWSQEQCLVFLQKHSLVYYTKNEHAMANKNRLVTEEDYLGSLRAEVNNHVCVAYIEATR